MDDLKTVTFELLSDGILIATLVEHEISMRFKINGMDSGNIKAGMRRICKAVEKEWGDVMFANFNRVCDELREG